MILDTHALLWMDRNDPALGSQARKHIESSWKEGKVAVSAISFWEVAMLVKRRRVVLPLPAALWREDWLQAGLEEIPLDGRIGLLAVQLESLHPDPADRFIMATAMDRNRPLVTADKLILNWEGSLNRIPADR